MESLKGSQHPRHTSSAATAAAAAAAAADAETGIVGEGHRGTGSAMAPPNHGGGADDDAPRTLADAALHRAETLIAQGDSERAIGFLHAAKAGCAGARASGGMITRGPRHPRRDHPCPVITGMHP